MCYNACKSFCARLSERKRGYEETYILHLFSNHPLVCVADLSENNSGRYGTVTEGTLYSGGQSHANERADLWRTLFPGKTEDMVCSPDDVLKRSSCICF